MLFVFDPRRTALILAGGDKSGERDFYDRMIPLAEALYERHLRELEKQIEDRMPTEKWSDIRGRFSPEEEAAIEAEVRAEVERIRLSELRKMRNLSQTALAKRLRIGQGDVSKLERRADMYVSTLRSYVEAAGGKLQILARFPNAAPIEIETFSKL